MKKIIVIIGVGGIALVFINPFLLLLIPDLILFAIPIFIVISIIKLIKYIKQGKCLKNIKFWFIIVIYMFLLSGVIFFLLPYYSGNTSFSIERNGSQLDFIKPNGFKVTSDYFGESSEIYLRIEPFKFPSGSIGDECFDNHGPLIEIRSAGLKYESSTSSLNYGSNISGGFPFAECSKISDSPTDMNNSFYDYKGTLSGLQKYKNYISCGSTTALTISYQPTSCDWKNKDYSKEFNLLFSSIKFSENKNRSSFVSDGYVGKIEKVLEEYYSSGRYTSVAACQSYSSTNDPEITKQRMEVCTNFFAKKLELKFKDNLIKIQNQKTSSLIEDKFKNLWISMVNYAIKNGKFTDTTGDSICNTNNDIISILKDMYSTAHGASCSSEDEYFYILGWLNSDPTGPTLCGDSNGYFGPGKVTGYVQGKQQKCIPSN